MSTHFLDVVTYSLLPCFHVSLIGPSWMADSPHKYASPRPVIERFSMIFDASCSFANSLDGVTIFLMVYMGYILSFLVLLNLINIIGSHIMYDLPST